MKKIITGILSFVLGTSLINAGNTIVYADSVDKFSLTAKENIYYSKYKTLPQGEFGTWFYSNVPISKTINVSDADFEMICYIVQAEVGNCSEKSKIAVTNVILNRVKDNRFPDTISSVLTQKNQFTSISNYYNKTNKPTDNTKNCVERALKGEDNSKGALYFYNPKYCSYSVKRWFESLCFCLEIDGQRYFKN